MSQLLLAESTHLIGFGVAFCHAMVTKEFQRTLFCVALALASVGMLFSAAMPQHVQACVMLSTSVPLHELWHQSTSFYLTVVAAQRLDVGPVPTAGAAGEL